MRTSAARKPWWCSWRSANLAGAILSCVLWAVASVTGWIDSVAFVSHVSMVALVVSFVAAWRSDVPTDRD